MKQFLNFGRLLFKPARKLSSRTPTLVKQNQSFQPFTSYHPTWFQQFRNLQSANLAVQEQGLIFRQLFHDVSYTYTYILGCEKTHKAVIIDPVYEMVNRDIKFAKEMKLELIYGLNTHVHADHVTGTGKLKEILPNFRSVLSKASGGNADILVEDGQVVQFGEQSIHCSATPGHTNGCMTYVIPDQSVAFTGDALLIRACGRTDFQQGDASQLYDSVHRRIFSLPDHYFLYPGHDYSGFSVTTVAEEKLLNPRLTLSKEKFVQFMKELNLKYPKMIDVAVPSNLKCGKLSKEAFDGQSELLDKS